MQPQLPMYIAILQGLFHPAYKWLLGPPCRDCTLFFEDFCSFQWFSFKDVLERLRMKPQLWNHSVSGWYVSQMVQKQATNFEVGSGGSPLRLQGTKINPRILKQISSDLPSRQRSVEISAQHCGSADPFQKKTGPLKDLTGSLRTALTPAAQKEKDTQWQCEPERAHIAHNISEFDHHPRLVRLTSSKQGVIFQQKKTLSVFFSENHRTLCHFGIIQKSFLLPLKISLLLLSSFTFLPEQRETHPWLPSLYTGWFLLGILIYGPIIIPM